MGENDLNFCILQQRRQLEIVLRQHQVCFGSGPALVCGFTEATPLATEEVSVTGKGKFCSRLQDFIGPAEKVILGHLEGGYILASWLIHGHCHGIDVVNGIEQFQGTEGVAHHLRIVICLHQNTKAMFVIHHMERSVGDDNGIRSAEALFYPAGEIYTLFDEDHRVSADFLGGFYQL